VTGEKTRVYSGPLRSWCSGKEAFSSFSEAQAIARKTARRHGEGKRAYHCPHCRLYHVGGGWGAGQPRKRKRV
jgi:hypothetical protein